MGWQTLIGTELHCPPHVANATVRDAVQSLQATVRKRWTHASPSFLTQSWFLGSGPYYLSPAIHLCDLKLFPLIATLT